MGQSTNAVLFYGCIWDEDGLDLFAAYREQLGMDESEDWPPPHCSDCGHACQQHDFCGCMVQGVAWRDNDCPCRRPFGLTVEEVRKRKEADTKGEAL